MAVDGRLSAHRPALPHGSWDTHIHIFEPSKHPFADTRAYTPAAASLGQYPADQTGCENIVIVLGTVQGTNNDGLVDVLTRNEPATSKPRGMIRGIAVIDLQDASDAKLDEMHAAGVRGIRLHEVSWGFGAQIEDAAVARKIQYAVARTARLNWIIDVYVHPHTWVAIAPTIRSLPRGSKIIADHWACLRPGQEDTDECRTIMDLVREKRIFVKLSSTERQFDEHPNGINSMERLARLFIEAGPDRLLYGSDWPHTNLPSLRAGKTRHQRLTDVEEFRKVDVAQHICSLRKWMEDEETWNNFWVKTPSSLFA